MSESEVKYKGICVELKLKTDIDNRGKASHKSEEKKKKTHSFVTYYIPQHLTLTLTITTNSITLNQRNGPTLLEKGGISVLNIDDTHAQ